MTGEEEEDISTEEKPSGSHQKTGGTTPAQKPTFGNKGSQNSPAIGPNETKTANINGASASLSNRMADYTIQVTGCRGSKSDQSVTIYFTVQHGLADQYLTVRAGRCKAFAGGIDYNKFATKVGVKKNNNTVPYNVEVSCEATIQYVPPSVQSFESVSVDLYTAHDGGNGKGKKTGKLELRNLKVAWQ